MDSVAFLQEDSPGQSQVGGGSREEASKGDLLKVCNDGSSLGQRSVCQVSREDDDVPAILVSGCKVQSVRVRRERELPGTKEEQGHAWSAACYSY